ncbi:MAG: hypothetical protein BWX50_01728 [Euryarchaeota archaeon ADurb.Bin009]|nr:MAG: hypothetical protein BWX50_01728 [Euryarchaeota archaeon ADurb.Bin009]
MMTISSISSPSKTPSSTESATAFATAACTGPNIWFTWYSFFRVTFGMTSVEGFVGRFGLMTARSGVWPLDSCDIEFANACPTAPSLFPMTRSICASSAPSPTNASPMRYMLMPSDSAEILVRQVLKIIRANP